MSILENPKFGRQSIFSRTLSKGQGMAKRALKHVAKFSASTEAMPKQRKRGERFTSKDWVYNLGTLVMSRSNILKRISGHLTFQIIVALLGATWFHFYPENFLNLGKTGHTLSGAALSLLLVFRTSSAYDRFWEARKILGSVVDNSRGLSRVAPSALPPRQAHEFGRMVIAFPYTLRLHLTGKGQTPIKNTTDAPDILPFFDEKKLSKVESRISKPMAVLSIMNQMLNSKEARYPNEDPIKTLEMFSQRQILQINVNQLVANTGACERILGCPVPMGYSRHLSRYLTLWCSTLPFVLAPILGWVSIPVIAFICWSLMSIEEVGHMIEEPFAGLPDDQVQTKRVADVIKRDTLAMYDQQLGIDLAEEPAKADAKDVPVAA